MAVGAELTDSVEEEGVILAAAHEAFFSLHVDHYCTVQVLNQGSSKFSVFSSVQISTCLMFFTFLSPNQSSKFPMKVALCVCVCVIMLHLLLSLSFSYLNMTTMKARRCLLEKIV